MTALPAGIWVGLFSIAALVAITQYLSGRIEAHVPAEGQFAHVEGIRIHYIDMAPSSESRSLPVLLIHGAGGNARDLLQAARELCQSRRVILVDRPGAGYSQRGSGRSASPVRQAELVAGLLGQLGIGRAIVVGHSFGGAVSLAMALNHREAVAGLVLVAPASHQWPGGKVSWYYRIASMPLIGRLFAETVAVPVGNLLYARVVKEIFKPERVPSGYFDESGTRLVLRPSNFLHNARDVAALHDNVGTLSRRYGEVDLPTVIITGDRDSVVSPDYHARRLAGEIAGARLLVVNDAGHMPIHTHPELLRRETDKLELLIRERNAPAA